MDAGTRRGQAHRAASTRPDRRFGGRAASQKPDFLTVLREAPSTASLGVVSLSDVAFGALLTAFRGVLSIFVFLSHPTMRPMRSAEQVVLPK
jgi:hypothetical protein